MSFTPDDRRPLGESTDLPPFPRELDEYARLEGLVGEEDLLLEEAEEEHKHERRERLHAISRELDHVWEVLRDRAQRHSTHEDKPSPES
jgi:CBS domain containing-hemolysin-like protein